MGEEVFPKPRKRNTIASVTAAEKAADTVKKSWETYSPEVTRDRDHQRILQKMVCSKLK